MNTSMQMKVGQLPVAQQEQDETIDDTESDAVDQYIYRDHDIRFSQNPLAKRKDVNMVKNNGSISSR